jgi:MazG family protein
VFGSDRLDTAEEVLTQWEQIKARERAKRRDASMFSGVPGSLPALLKALRLSSKACRVGFDWPDRDHLLQKVDEELSELRKALAGGERRAIEEEIGDLLFTLVNVARMEEIDPEEALQHANRKFMNRFHHVEKRLSEEGLQPAPEHRPRMEALWEEAKAVLRRTSPDRTSPSGGISDSAPRSDPQEKPS